MRSTVVLQLAAWTVVFAIDLALARVAMPSDALGWSLYDSGSLALVGLALTSALAAAHRRWLPARGALGVAIAAGAAVAGAAAWYLVLFALDVLADWPWPEPLAAGLFDTGMLLLFIMLAWHAAFLALRASARAAEAERLARESRLLALRYQLNPHFLFNALNSAVALIDEDPPRAQEMLTQLSALLRRTLAEDASGETTLERELELIARYVEIQRIRFEDKLAIEVDVADEARRCAVPPLLLHALVENAVKHGLRTASAMPVAIRLAARYDGRALRVAVENDGRMTPRGEGVGLRNVVSRLDALYPGRHRFDVVERHGRVRARMEILSPRVLA